MSTTKAKTMWWAAGSLLVGVLILGSGCGQRLHDDGPVTALTEASFAQEVEASTGVVVVDFWASWCPPCRRIAPLLKDLAQEFEGRARIGKVDVDRQSALADKFGIRALPTLVLFKKGEAVDQLTGARSKEAYREWIEAWLRDDGAPQPEEAQEP